MEEAGIFTEDDIFKLEQGKLLWKNFAVPVEDWLGGGIELKKDKEWLKRKTEEVLSEFK